MTYHDWKNVDFDGTRGWFQCAVCGHKQHFPQAPAPASLVSPPGDALVYWPPMPCNELVSFKVAQLSAEFRKTLKKAETPTIRDNFKKGVREVEAV